MDHCSENKSGDGNGDDDADDDDEQQRQHSKISLFDINKIEKMS